MNLPGIFNFPGTTQQPASAGQTGQSASVQPGPSAAGAPQSQPAQAGLDHADLSAGGLFAAMSAQGAQSDVRMALVNQVQSAIQSGTYNVPADAVAGSLIQNMLGQGN
jgi:flagellar biosynthesis anti-sigma factor FlgM